MFFESYSWSVLTEICRFCLTYANPIDVQSKNLPTMFNILFVKFSIHADADICGLSVNTQPFKFTLSESTVLSGNK